jgi:hypothetical protein
VAANVFIDSRVGGLHLGRWNAGGGSDVCKSSTDLLRLEEDDDRSGELGWPYAGWGVGPV